MRGRVVLVPKVNSFCPWPRGGRRFMVCKLISSPIGLDFANIHGRLG